MITLEQRILVNLHVLTRDYTRTWHAIPGDATRERREALARQSIAANKREGKHVEGWFAAPRLGSPMQRSRAIAKLVEQGLIEVEGHGRGRLVRITDAGRAAAEAMEGGAA